MRVRDEIGTVYFILSIPSKPSLSYTIHIILTYHRQKPGLCFGLEISFVSNNKGVSHRRVHYFSKPCQLK